MTRAMIRVRVTFTARTIRLRDKKIYDLFNLEYEKVKFLKSRIKH